ncbi:MAG: hypothetical protein IT376_16755 [Polyangiaceae bacterium]|nr:hypothetical protein [Polyangiaceae bacterium]
MTSRASAWVAFRRVRIALLAAVLVVVLLWAWNDRRRRHERTQWRRPVQVALVLLRDGAVDPAALGALRQRIPALEARLAEEMARHRGSASRRPFSFTVYGPVDAAAAPPRPTADDLRGLATHAWETWRYFRGVDRRAGVEWRAADSRIYLTVRPPQHAARAAVEGQSEQGGRVGSVEVELDATMVDLALFVATHELLHTLGATDKYDPRGMALLPDGLADPTLSPLYPQVAAEIMARNVVVAPHRERAPETLDELAVGPVTAREIGWTPPAPRADAPR